MRKGFKQGLLGRGVAAVHANGAENQASEQTDVPQEHEEPEWVIAGGAPRKVGEVGVHGGEECLREPRAIRERDACRQGRRDDPARDGQDEGAQVEIELDALRNLKLHARGRASDRRSWAYYSSRAREGGA